MLLSLYTLVAIVLGVAVYVARVKASLAYHDASLNPEGKA